MSSAPSTHSRRSKGSRSSSSLPASIFEKSRMSSITRSRASPLDRTISANSRCSGRQLGVEQQAGHADDGVHRRPDLVAHRGQEGALRPRRRLRLLARPLELGDVARLVDGGGGERAERLSRPCVLGRVEVGLERVEREHPDQAIARDHQGDRHPRLDPVGAERILEALEAAATSPTMTVSRRVTSAYAGSLGSRTP